MKILDKLAINHVSGGGYSNTVPANTRFPGYIFDLYGNCNITKANHPSDILWDGSDMALGMPTEVTVETTQFGGFDYNITYLVTKYANKCRFEQLPQSAD